MSRCSLYNLDVPDEMAELDLKGASAADIITATYYSWLKETEGKRDQPGKEKFNWSYNLAAKMLRPFREMFKGELNTDEIPALRYTGAPGTDIYLSVLFNETCLERLIMGRSEVNYFYNLGRGIPKGKTLEISADLKSSRLQAGNHACGGTVINNNPSATELCCGATECLAINNNHADEFGQDAEGGLFVNNGRASFMGVGAKGGIFLNFKKVVNWLGYMNEGGIFLNFGEYVAGIGEQALGGVHLNFAEAKNMGDMAKSGIFINAGKLRDNDYLHRGDTVFPPKDEDPLFRVDEHGILYMAGEKTLKDEKELSGFVAELKAAGLAKEVPKIEDVCRKIDGFVRNKYARQVA